MCLILVLTSDGRMGRIN
uniref:Uncharacterized protein n=1 Tax=Anguilla anguilla TaxID=7936 RepID=A0A0E9T5C7_ANGAN